MPETSSTERPRGGRRPGKPDTREQILDSARCLIAQGGCGSTSLRAIARHAGVDAALITHYFGSRDGLLREALQHDDLIELDFCALLAAGPPAQFGERLVSEFLEQLDVRHDRPHPLLLALGMGTDNAVAREVLEEIVARSWTEPLTRAIAQTGLTDQPQLAAQLVATQTVALSIASRLPGMFALEALDREQIVTHFGRLVQVALTVGRDESPS